MKYDAIARLLHWGMAVPIVILLAFGTKLMGHDPNWRATFHTSAGFGLLALIVVRLLWKHHRKSPDYPDSMKLREKRVAFVVAHAMYLAMIAIPLTGWFAYTEHVRRTHGISPASFFGVADIPLLPDFGVDFHFLHKWIGRGLMAAIALHVLAALKHHFITRDDVLRRML